VVKEGCWDLQRIMENFTFLELGLTEDDVQFCRRVGEKGEAPRALEVCLYVYGVY
jgi:hypothetical protein